MRHRAFRRKSDGQYIDAVFGTDGDTFSAPEESQRSDLATALGVLPAELEAVEGDADPRRGVLVKLPEGAPPEPDPEVVRLKALVRDVLREDGLIS